MHHFVEPDCIILSSLMHHFALIDLAKRSSLRFRCCCGRAASTVVVGHSLIVLAISFLYLLFYCSYLTFKCCTE